MVSIAPPLSLLSEQLNEALTKMDVWPYKTDFGMLLSDIEKMISLKGMIIRSSSIIPEIREAVFRCHVCGYYSDPIVVDRGNGGLFCCDRWFFMSL